MKASPSHSNNYLNKLLLITLLLSFSSKVSAQFTELDKAPNSPKIYYGIYLDPTLTPIVKLDIATSVGNFNCTGTLISKRKVLTAAHCLNQGVLTSIGVFFPNVDYIGASAFMISPDYDPSTFKNDVGLIELSRDAPTGIKPVSLSTKKPKRGNTISVFGYGLEENGFSGYFKGTFMKVVKTDRLKIYAIGGGNTCNGDSGGPVMFEYKSRRKTVYGLVGITSYGSVNCFNLDSISTSIFGTKVKRFIKKYGN